MQQICLDCEHHEQATIFERNPSTASAAQKCIKMGHICDEIRRIRVNHVNFVKFLYTPHWGTMHF
jgi:hypothetical protein